MASEGWLSMMLSGLATLPWLTEIVNPGSAAEVPEPVPRLTAQPTRAMATAASTAIPP